MLVDLLKNVKAELERHKNNAQMLFLCNLVKREFTNCLDGYKKEEKEVLLKNYNCIIKDFESLRPVTGKYVTNPHDDSKTWWDYNKPEDSKLRIGQYINNVNQAKISWINVICISLRKRIRELKELNGNLQSN